MRASAGIKEESDAVDGRSRLATLNDALCLGGLAELYRE